MTDNAVNQQHRDEPTIEELETEGDRAADYIEGLLDIADLDGDIDINVVSGRVYLAVNGGGQDLDRLAHPDTVQAMQDLTRLAAQAKTERFSRLILDIAGSREARAGELKGLVDAAVAQIAAGRAEVALEPMSSYERKLVHDEVADRGYRSESRGEGRDRRLVITAA